MVKNVPTRSLAALFALAVAAGGCAARARSSDFQGIVEYDERLLAFEVSGKIEQVPGKRGDHVKKGDVLAQVDATLERLSRDARADELQGAQAELALLEAGTRSEDIASLAAQLRAAEASEALLLKSRDRAVALRSTQAISQAELDRAEAELARAANERASLAARLGALRRGARSEEIARARARAEAAQSALALAEARLERFIVRAGSEGVLLDVHVDPGELAAPGVPVATLADIGHPYVDVFVPQAELAGIAVGKKARIKVDASSSPLAGIIEHVASRTEFTPKFLFSERERPNLVVRVRVRADDPQGVLHAGVPAFVRLVGS
jgi:HlyD family secretion protein